MIRLPSRVSQSAVVQEQFPGMFYLDTSASVAEPGMRLLADVDDGWDDMMDLVPVLVVKDADNFGLYLATWSPSSDQLTLAIEELLVGSIAVDDAVTVSVVASGEALTMLGSAHWTRAITASGAISMADAGHTLRCTGASPVTLTLPDTVTPNTRVEIVQEGAGAVTLSCGGAATINGATADVPLSGQYGSATCYAGSGPGAWIVLLRAPPA